MNVSRQQGFTIVELMVAATLGLLILAGAISMFVSNKRIYTEQDELGRLQENARFAIDMLVNDIRMAGHTGCNDDTAVVTNHVTGAGDPKTLYAFTPIEGSENAAVWEPSDSTEEQADMLAGSDSITVRYLAHTDIYTMQPAMNAGAFEIYTSAGGGISQGDIIAVADCNRADIVVATTAAATSTAGCTSVLPTDACKDTFEFKAGSISGAEPFNATATLSKTYDSEAAVLSYVTARYFVGTDADGNPVLHRKSTTEAAEEVIEGVENMQIMYGEDTAGNDRIADIYRTAAAVVNWDSVVSVRIALLMRTIDEYGTDLNTETYDLLGTTINPTDDRRRRRVFTTTIQLRNRISDS